MRTLALVLLVPMLLAAKASTGMITVSGEGLRGSFAITDAPLLEKSNAWSYDFIDRTRPALQKAPIGRPYYEVSFFIGDTNRTKACVLFFYPRSAAEDDLVYLPGEGPVWELNIGTMFRKDRDGKWSYASPEWAALMKSAIAHGALAEEHAVRIDQWTKPQSGWLYVLDAQPDTASAGTAVLLVDPKTEAVMGRIHAAPQSDIALSPDGTRLYIASGERESGELAVIDTASGTVRHVLFPRRLWYRPWYAGLPPYSRMAFADGGRELLILTHRVISPERVEAEIARFDTAAERFAPAAVNLGACSGFSDFMRSAESDELRVLCSGMSSRRVLGLDGGARATADCCGRELFPQQWPESPDGRRVYAGDGEPTPDNMAAYTGIRVFDARTWRPVATLGTSLPYWSAAASRDGKFIYALAPKQKQVMVIDAATVQEVRTFRLGGAPAMAAVAP